LYASAFTILLVANGSLAAADGHPDISGIWQTMSTANWDLQDHPAAAGPFFQLGAVGAIPSGQGVVEGGEIPYKPEALKQKQENFQNRWNLDPEVKCYMGGIPRSNYMPYPFQILQTPRAILMDYEYASSNRVINMEKKPVEAAVDTWMGTANATGKAIHWLWITPASTMRAGSTAPATSTAINCTWWSASPWRMPII
jgi:hypothetical protein